MTKDQNDQIKRGQDLWLLSNSVLFIPFKEKLAEMITDLEDEQKRWDCRTAAGSIMLVGITSELSALRKLKEWMQEEIDLGAELLKKRESEKVPA